MAAPSGLDPSNINLYGAAPADTEEYQKALQASVDALQQRYENPNWFNVAAGFLKPQLGGFAASLGSANEALGANLEKQRETQLPIAQMRAQLAASKIAMGQRSTAAKELADWQATGRPMDDATYARLTALAPDAATAAAAKAAYEGERANQGIMAQQQTLRQAQGAQALTLAQQQFASGAISRDEYQNELARVKAAYAPTQPVTATRPINAPGTTAAVEAAPVDEAMRTATAGTGASPLISGGPADKQDYLRALQDSIATTFPRAQQGDPRAQADLKGMVNAALKEGATVAGTPEMDAAFGRSSGAAPAPAAPTVGKPREKVVISSPLSSSEAGLPPDVVAARAAANEEAAKAKFDKLEKAAGPGEYPRARSVLEDQMSLIRKNPELAKQVTAILSKGNFASQVGTALEKGVGVSVGGLSGQVHLPVAAMAQAGWNDKQRELAQTMVNNYSKLAVYQQRLGGVNPNAASNAEAGLYNGVVPTMDTTPNAALRAMGHMLTDLDATNAQYKFANDVYQGRHPDVSVAKGVQDRYAAIMAHPSYSAVYDPYSKEHADINAAFQRHMAKKP